MKIRIFCNLFCENHIQRVSKIWYPLNPGSRRSQKGLISHGEAHAQLKRVLPVELRVAQNEDLILKGPCYMSEPLHKFTPIERWFGLHNIEQTGRTEDLNPFNGEASNITNDAAFDR